MKIFQWPLFALLLLAIPCFSQSYSEVTFSYGIVNYYGDMTREFFSTDEVNPGIQLSLNRHFDKQHALRFNFLIGQITGDDRNDELLATRGNAFQATIFEGSVMGQIDLIGNERFSRRVGFKRTLTPYFLVGAGVIYANPKVTYSDPNNKDAKIDYPNVHIFAPVGGGLKYDLNLKLYLGIEAGIRFTVSDYLDGVQASGNAYSNDGYIFTGLMAGYRFIN
jgi:OmpA-OmpF porin, OOP family